MFVFHSIENRKIFTGYIYAEFAKGSLATSIRFKEGCCPGDFNYASHLIIIALFFLPTKFRAPRLHFTVIHCISVYNDPCIYQIWWCTRFNRDLWLQWIKRKYYTKSPTKSFAKGVDIAWFPYPPRSNRIWDGEISHQILFRIK